MLEAIQEFPFLLNALLGGWLASAICGVVGTLVIVKRISYIAGGIAHAVMAGMGAAMYWGGSTVMGALVAAVLIAWLIAFIKLRFGEAEDTVISALWSVGMATGIIFMAKTPGYNSDLMLVLFGNILMVSSADLWLMLGLSGVVVLVVALFYKYFQAICFDEEFARLRGVNVDAYYVLLLTLIAITVVLLIQVVGLILVLALLILPAAAARQFRNTLSQIMGLAMIFGAILTTGGTSLSYFYDTPTGPTIILLCGGFYLLAIIGRTLYARSRLTRNTVARG